MQYLVLDTETTGLDPRKERIIEFAAVPIEGLMIAHNQYQQYFNPECEISHESYKIHKLNNEFLKPFPTFAQKAHELREYLEGKVLIIHNAAFDIGFLNAEFKRCNILPLTNHVIDTLHIARAKYPGKRASLDSLCVKFNINLNERTAKGHGALLDSQLLAMVYLKMITDQVELDLDNNKQTQTNQAFSTNVRVALSIDEAQIHADFIESL